MEESQEILIRSLENSGVSIAEDVLSVRDLTPATLLSICAQSLNLIENNTSFCTELPDSMADKFRICTDIALAIKNLGYIGDMTYYKFLYPYEEDLYKLVRFLVERLSDSRDGITASGVRDDGWKTKEDNFQSTSEDMTKKTDNEGVDLNLQRVEAVLKHLTLTSEVPELSKSEAEDASISEPFNVHLFSQKMDEMAIDNTTSFRVQNLSENKLAGLEGRKDIAAGPGESEAGASGNEETSRNDKHLPECEKIVTFLEDPSSKIKYEIKKSQNQEKLLQKEVTARTSELHQLEEELELLKAAADMAFDDHPIEFYLEQLNEQLDARRHNLAEVQSHWDALRGPLEEKKRRLEESLYADKPDAQEKLQKLREAELEKQTILSETRKREEEQYKLYADLEKQPKVASRRSYIERIKEITKNSRKLDVDVERILRETRELQLESNSIQERLDRTYAVVDEMVFREAKKDTAGRQAYGLLTSIHESFEHISEKIRLTDKVRREVVEHEKKLATMACRSLDIYKLQADLDAIIRENEYLEKHLENN